MCSPAVATSSSGWPACTVLGCGSCPWEADDRVAGGRASHDPDPLRPSRLPPPHSQGGRLPLPRPDRLHPPSLHPSPHRFGRSAAGSGSCRRSQRRLIGEEEGVIPIGPSSRVSQRRTADGRLGAPARGIVKTPCPDADGAHDTEWGYRGIPGDLAAPGPGVFPSALNTMTRASRRSPRLARQQIGVR